MAQSRIPIFVGPGSQRGYGLGGMLSGLFRTAMPFVKRGAQSLAKEVGKQALTTGADILGDVMGGESLKSSTLRRSKAAGHRMKRQALERAKKALQTGRGQRGRGKRVINRESSSKTVITTRDTKKKGRRPTRGQKGIKLPRGKAPIRRQSSSSTSTSKRRRRGSASSSTSGRSSRLSNANLNAYINSLRENRLSPVSPYTPVSIPARSVSA